MGRLVLSRKVNQKILIERDGRPLWLTIARIGDDQYGNPTVRLLLEGDPCDFVITRQELLPPVDEKLEAEVEKLLA